MTWYFIPYAGALWVAAGLLAGALRLFWSRRAAPGGGALAGLLGAMLVWTVGAALEAMAAETPAKIFFAVLQYPGVVSAPVFYLLWCLEYTRRAAGTAAGRRRGVWAVPAAIFLAAATNDWHGWLWSSFTPAPGNALIYGHGPLYWVLVIYSYGLVAVGVVALLRTLRRSAGLYRRQFVAMLISSIFPVAGNLTYVLGLGPFPGFDLAPLLFAFTALGLTWSFLRHDLSSLVPVAQEAVVESLQDGVLVLDLRGRIVVANAALRRWLGLSLEAVGQPAAAVLADRPAVLAGLRTETPTELHLNGRQMEVRPAPLRDGAGRLTGKIMAVRDITERQRAEAEIREANTRLQVQLATVAALQNSLREQAVRDPLTGLFNRRYLDETLRRELARAERDGSSVSLVMLDLDHFKAFNDRHGHAAGDQVLMALAALLQTRIRAGDFACRYGGEEFLVVLPGATAEAAAERADSWRQALAALAVDVDGQALTATLSAGVAAFPAHAAGSEALRRCADQALYAAKAAGRNRVRVFAPPGQ